MSFLHHHEEVRFRALVRHELFSAGGSDLSGDRAFRIVYVAEHAGRSRACGNARRIQTRLDEFFAAFSHALHWKTGLWMRPSDVVRARCNAVVASDAAAWIRLDHARFRIMEVGAERTRRNARGVFALLALDQNLHRTLRSFDCNLADVGRQPVPALDRPVEHVGIVGLSAGYYACSTSNALSRIEKMRKFLGAHLFSPLKFTNAHGGVVGENAYDLLAVARAEPV